MYEIEILINELLDLNIADGLSFSDRLQKQNVIISKLKYLAIKHNTIIGHVLKFEAADSYSYYVITEKDNNGKVHTEWVNYMDGWVNEIIEAYDGDLPLLFVREKLNNT